MSKKRLLVNVVRRYESFGGVENVVNTISKIATKYLNLTSLIVSFNYKSQYTRIESEKILEFPNTMKFGRVYFSLHYKKILKNISEKDPIFIFHFPGGQIELYSEFYKSIPGKKICFFHGEAVSRNKFIEIFYNQFFVKSFLKSMDIIITTSPNIVKSSDILKLYREKIKVIPLYVDTKHFYPKNKDYNLIPKKFLNNGIENIIIYTGKFRRYKGLDYLVKSLSLINKNCGLILIGNGPKKNYLEMLVKKLKLQDRVEFIEHVPFEQLPSYYSLADVFVLPSIDRGEGFGLVGLEAMACGTPVITTELGTGTSYYNIHGLTGLVVPPKNVEALANAIEYIVQNKEKFDKEIIRKRAEEFSVEIFEKKIIELINTLE
jgi:glycosyltransferase involved in cell wall biosynthesis